MLCVGNDADALVPGQVEPSKSYLYQLGDLSIDFTHRRVMVAGRDVRPKAFWYDLLPDPTMNAGRGDPRGLCVNGEGPTHPGSPRVIRTQRMRLRQWLGEDGESLYLHLRCS